MKLIEEGEIVDVSWNKDEESKARAFLEKNTISELRYGKAIIGGAWPIKPNGGGSGYFYKHDAKILTEYINSIREKLNKVSP